MADKADVASEYMERELELALKKQLGSPVWVGIDLAATDPNCEECGEEIPAKRREALPGCATCVDCQRALEHQNKHLAG